MEPKVFTLQNKGMNRDLSVSKTGEASAYENHNIRITAKDHDTLLSVTNERGNKEIALSGLSIEGTLLGWNVLNRHIILFTHEGENTDRIYRIDYNPGEEEEFVGELLIEGNLNFSLDNPIESVVYFETEQIQKIYWVDGRNVLRFMNFMAGDEERALWDETFFDSNRSVNFGVTVNIDKDNSGNTRPNGTTQYILTYLNSHGQESGCVWISDLVYLSPVGRGGSPDETNNNSVILSLSNLDTRFTHFRIYSITRTSYNGTVQAYIVYEGETMQYNSGQTIRVVDDGGVGRIAVDASSLLFLGSREVHPGTLTHKDQTLFLGDLQSIGRTGIEEIKKAVEENMFVSGSVPTSKCVSFEYEYGINFNDSPDTYSFDNQLKYTSSQITTFKGGEKYRFGIVLHAKDGSSTDAIWIGDKVNEKYPKITAGKIQRVVAYCTLPQQVIDAINNAGIYSTVQLVMAEATYADRSVKAQGIVNPTMFNVWDRHNNGLYAMSSWISRPRHSDFAWRHFDPVKNSTSSYGEIECNYWTTEDDPTPYYRKDTTTDEIVDEFDGEGTYTHTMVVIGILRDDDSPFWKMEVYVVKANADSSTTAALYAYNPAQDAAWANVGVGLPPQKSLAGGIDATIYAWKDQVSKSIFSDWGAGGETLGYRLYTKLQSWLIGEVGLIGSDVPQWKPYIWNIMQDAATNHRRSFAYYTEATGSTYYASKDAAMAASLGSSRWEQSTALAEGNPAAYYRKHLMFVDENVITLNSPELEYEAVSFDGVENYKFRIVGVAKVSDTASDYSVTARHGNMSGENLVYCNFKESKKSGNINGLISWPLWRDYGLIERQTKEGTTESYTPVEPETERTSYDYEWGASGVSYWLHMWNHLGRINLFQDTQNSDYGDLENKVFANLRYCYDTRYNNYDQSQPSYSVGLRIFNQVASQYLDLRIGSGKQYYDAVVSTSLMPPGSHKYPIIYSFGSPETNEEHKSNSAYLYSNAPIQLDYYSNPHAVMSLPVSGSQYTILPKYAGMSSEDTHINDTPPTGETGPLVPWLDESNTYSVSQGSFSLAEQSGYITENDKYFYIGEIYKDFDALGVNDSRYGGTTKAAVAGNRFIPAGPQYVVSSLFANTRIKADNGDTFFQRWDCVKTRPIEGMVNGVADIVSVMLETHINIDGRYDKQRGVRYLASLDWQKFGNINYAYSQPDNYYTRRVLGDDNNLDSYRSTVTWSLEKHDAAQIDEWSHVTLASSLALDGDKGACRALRRFQNSLIAFQDKGIAEILFNSRTQISTTDGNPIEIANSGKVDGKRYVSNKYGCINKWSIVDGKSALYFVDNINKVFCGFGGEGIQPISSRYGFDAWFRQINSIKPWKPEPFTNIVSFYDRIHSDVYLIRDTEDDMPCLVYNELLGTFTSFFDYGRVPMMVNVEDRFVSFKDDRLWLQNEGFYGNLFGRQYDFWTRYRVTPDPYGDKIWTNIEYRADWYEVLGDDMSSVVPEESLINGDSYGELDNTYKENETFSTLRIWNEYQTTGDISFSRDDNYIDPARKKFRIWRLTIPRALKEGTNRHGLDRIRNPWIELLFRKTYDSDDQKKQLMQLHDIVVKYFE